MADSALRLALDLGTTTLAGQLLTAAGTVVAQARQLNPQASFGSDVVRRLELAHNGRGPELQAALVEGVNTLLAELCRQGGVTPAAIGAAAAAGNPGICHLLLALPVARILFPPYRPSESLGRPVSLCELGIPLPPVYLFPLLSGYVGGDLVAFLYGRRPESGITGFYLDVGTNGEMALQHAGQWRVTSVAAGPAFEGGNISCGMPLGPGAVTGVALVQDRWELDVAAGGAPRGLAGSGLVAAIAAARSAGLLDATGRIVAPEEVAGSAARYLAPDEAGNAIRLYRDAATEIHLSQQDVRNFQLAKGAVLAGTRCLLAKAQLAEEAVERVEITGALGFSLAAPALKGVAMLPAKMVDKAGFVPGGALAGVSRFLTEPDGAAQVRELAARLRPLPLSGTPIFEQTFLTSLDF